jgi:hypothetical protein
LESKNKTNSTKCILFFVKHGCEAKVKIENHNDHDGINVAQFYKEYPALETNDRKNLQYDFYHGKKNPYLGILNIQSH